MLQVSSSATTPKFDPVIHPQRRLELCALLAGVDAVEFRTVREALTISESSLSKHVKYLSEAGYVDAAKKPHGVRTRTWLRLTKAGREAYEGHVAELRRIVANNVD